MKKILQTVTAFMVALAMVASPVADAQTRGRQANGSTTNSSGGAHRAPSASRPTNNNNSRPGNHHGNSNGAQRPGNNGNNRPAHPGNNHNKPNNNRPGNNGNNRPGNNHGGNHKPDNNRPGNNRPGNNGYRPGHGPTMPGHNRPNHGINHGTHRPGGNNFRPSHGHRPTPPPPPRRHPAHYHHHVPFFGSFHRPTPPRRWHYVSGGPSFGTILGVALGTAIGASINALVNSGYTVSSYGNDVVYLSNVPQMNYNWPDAALYYSNGVLSGSQFTYPSAYYDMTRYNSLYNVFTSQYGMPVQTMNQGGIISSTWYGPANRFVTLSFNSQYNGSFYTTLSFGN